MLSCQGCYCPLLFGVVRAQTVEAGLAFEPSSDFFNDSLLLSAGTPNATSGLAAPFTAFVRGRSEEVYSQPAGQQDLNQLKTAAFEL